MTQPLIAILADDLTGAADTAAGMLGAGRPLVTWPRSDGAIAWHDEDRIVSIDAGTRQATPAEAANRIRDLAVLFRTAGFAHLYKKVDSTLRGHIGVEVKAALEGWRQGSLAVVAPAFPAMGRTTVDGRQRIGDTAVDGPPVAERLASAAVPVTTLALADVRGGVLNRIFRARAEAGNRAIVCDAVTDADLAAIAAAGAMLEAAVVWVGSGGLARRLFTDSNPSRHQMQMSHPIPSGPVLVVAGSLTAITRSQAARVAAAGARPVTVSAEDLSTRSPALERNRNEIERHLRAGMDVVVGIGRPGTAPAADTALVDHLARMLESCQSLVGGVVATGGDTAAALLKQWGIGGLRLIGEVETGVPIGLAIGPRPLIVALKAGGFGHDATLALARTAVRSFLRCSLAP
ncbi:MAG TPA: four-carbon acid sugar kinase family protein [Vicinamibacterales bacterium]|nr:four-carbon acid sugar kinase family protein [Vicinamibacterales bacterium]